MDMLKTTLPSSVSDDGNLIKFGEICLKVKLTANRRIVFSVGNNSASARIVGSGNFFTDNTYSTSAGKSVDFAKASGNKTLYVSSGEYKIFIQCRYLLRILNFTGYFLNGEMIEVDDIKSLFYGDPVNVDLYNADVPGDVSVIAGKENIISFSVSSRFLSGNLSSITGSLPFFGSFIVEDSKVSGSIAELGRFITLTNVSVKNTLVTGSYQDLAAAMASNGRTSGSCTIKAADGVSHTVNFPYSG